MITIIERNFKSLYLWEPERKYHFHFVVADDFYLLQTYEVCTGAQLACSNEILNRMGQYNKGSNVKQNTQTIPG